jgi:hypothetical protein
MDEKLELLQSIVLKKEKARFLYKQLESYFALEKLGIKKEDIVGQRKAKILGTNTFSTKLCQVKLKDGTEHFVPYELIYFE